MPIQAKMCMNLILGCGSISVAYSQISKIASLMTKAATPAIIMSKYLMVGKVSI